MNTVMIKSENPQMVANPTVRSTSKASGLAAENSFAMLLGGFIQPNSVNNQTSLTLTGSLDDLIAHIDQLIAQLLGQEGMSEEDLSQLFDEGATDPLVMMLMQSENLPELLQLLSSQIRSENSKEGLLGQSYTMNSLSVLQQTVGLVSGTRSDGPQTINTNSVMDQHNSAASPSVQLKEVLLTIRTMLVAAKEGQVTLNDGDLGKLAQMLKQLSSQSQQPGEFIRTSVFEESKVFHFRSFESVLTNRASLNMNEGSSFNQQSLLSKQEQSNSSSNLSSSSPTKVGFHQLISGNMQTVETMNTQVTAKEPIVRAQYVQKDLNDWMVRQLQMTRFPNGVSEAKIRLFPHNLGSVEVRLSVQQGILTAQFITETRAGKELIDSQLAGLRSSLISSGLQVEKIEVNMPNTPNPNNGQAQDSLNRQGSGQKEQQFSEDTYQEDDLEEDFSTVFEEFSQAI